MSTIKIKQIAGPDGANTAGSTIIFESGAPKWTATNSSALLLPSGNTTARPTGLNGHIRYNSETSRVEAYENGSWKNVITDAEQLKRYSFRIDFNASQQPASATNVPSGWTIDSFGSNVFTVTHNLGKTPFLFTAQGWNTSTSRYQARPMTGTFSFNTDPNDITKVYFVGVGASVAGTVASGHSIFWLMF